MLAVPTKNGGAMVEQLQPKRRRILFVANQACGNPALCGEVRAHAEGAADVLVVAPVLSSPLHRWTSDEVEDRALAEERLEASIGCLRRHGLRAHGTLGDAEPVRAIADALFGFPADEIVICLEEPERPHWLRKGVVERARERFQVPVTELDVAAREPAALA
jgi:GABA permease